MSTAPQSPVTVIPPLPNRRNAELLLLCFAAAITAVALLIVEANQEQGLTLDLLPTPPHSWRCSSARIW